MTHGQKNMKLYTVFVRCHKNAKIR